MFSSWIYLITIFKCPLNLHSDKETKEEVLKGILNNFITLTFSKCFEIFKKLCQQSSLPGFGAGLIKDQNYRTKITSLITCVCPLGTNSISSHHTASLCWAVEPLWLLCCFTARGSQERPYSICLIFLSTALQICFSCVRNTFLQDASKINTVVLEFLPCIFSIWWNKGFWERLILCPLYFTFHVSFNSALYLPPLPAFPQDRCTDTDESTSLKHLFSSLCYMDCIHNSQLMQAGVFAFWNIYAMLYEKIIANSMKSSYHAVLSSYFSLVHYTFKFMSLLV